MAKIEIIKLLKKYYSKVFSYTIISCIAYRYVNVKNFFKDFILFVLVFSVIFILSIFSLSTKSLKTSDFNKEGIIFIEKNSSFFEFRNKLFDKKIIKDKNLFYFIYKIFDKTIKVGKYSFLPEDNLISILKKVTSGDALLEKLTIIEGTTNREIKNKIKNLDIFSGTISSIPKEGYLHPDTYFFAEGTEKQRVIDNMEQKFHELTKSLWENRQKDLPLKNLYEAMILASIVEKETPLEREKPIVASVFINRLNIDMKLQSDATVAYAVSGGLSKLGRTMYRTDWKFASKWNTYIHKGLPPTAISNFNLSSLKSVLSPAKTDYYFFVADGTGGHIFSKTGKEHEANVEKWRAWKKKNLQ